MNWVLATEDIEIPYQAWLQEHPEAVNIKRDEVGVWYDDEVGSTHLIRWKMLRDWYKQKEAAMGWVSAADKSELEMGIAVEKEHAGTIKKLLEKAGLKADDAILQEAFKMIAEDHLREMSDYYTRLKKMEAKH